MKAAELRRIRLQLGLTQGRFAKELGVARNTVTRWETEARKISPTVAIAIRSVASRLTPKSR